MNSNEYAELAITNLHHAASHIIRETHDGMKQAVSRGNFKATWELYVNASAALLKLSDVVETMSDDIFTVSCDVDFAKYRLKLDDTYREGVDSL